jgi:uncharacterized protein YbcC (UPF0753/DUF2309 family)
LSGSAESESELADGPRDLTQPAAAKLDGAASDGNGRSSRAQSWAARDARRREPPRSAVLCGSGAYLFDDRSTHMVDHAGLGAAPEDTCAQRTAADELVLHWVTRLAKWLPEQRPLSVFVHTNPLEALQSQPFHGACEAATRIRRARTTLTAERYRALLAQRRIRADDVALALKRIRALELAPIDELPRAASCTLLLSTIRPAMAIEMSELVDGFLLRILPVFLDLGSALWPLPPEGRQGLLAMMRWLARTPFGIPEPWLSGVATRLGGPEVSALALIVSCLERRGDRETAWPSILHEAMFALPGYTGMIHRLEHVAAERPPGVEVRLLDYLAVRLVVEELALLDVARRLFGRHATLSTLAESLRGVHSPPATVGWSRELGAFQDAYEEDYIRSFIGGIVMAQEMERDPAPEDAAVQLVVCIDDRCESLRRHVEECVPRSETLGSAGFFGIAIKHRAPSSVDDIPSCPAPVTPVKRVTEVLDAAESAHATRRNAWRRAFGHWAGDDASRGPLRGILASFTGFVRAPRALTQQLFPELFVEPAHDFEGTRLLYAASDDGQGFTLDEQAALVHGNLQNIGLTERFARWVLIVGHGSMAVNNQFSSGYQCGACGGQRGGINARVFCAFANDPGVRSRLAGRGVLVPDDTLFVPGEHDTAMDHIRWFDLEALVPARRAELDEIRGQLELALERNAKERARRFEDIPLDTDVRETARRVRSRCADYAETRPEYNHATNASCVIGRRALTRGLFLDRRSFLVSYDTTHDDPDAKTLERLLAAPLPVCAGISLEYFFSAMDPQRFGCGTKLPHNVVGLLGVANGSEGDLRPGLWSQTIEIHEPIRLVTLVEAEPEAVTRVLERLPGVKAAVVNAWIHLFACSPSGRGFFRWRGADFQPYQALPHLLFELPTSLDACAHTREDVRPCIIGSGARLQTPRTKPPAMAP